MIIHYMKKTIYLDLLKQDISDLKPFCHTLHINQKKLDSIEKKYSKSRYVLSDFWNSYFKSKKAESNKLQRRNSMPQSVIDNHELRVHSRSENYSLMTVEKDSEPLSHPLNNSLIISMKIREELKAVQSEMPSDQKEFDEGAPHTIHPLQRTLFTSSQSNNSNFSKKKEDQFLNVKISLDKKTRDTSEKEKIKVKDEHVDFIERTSNLVQSKFVKEFKKKKKENRIF